MPSFIDANTFRNPSMWNLLFTAPNTESNKSNKLLSAAEIIPTTLPKPFAISSILKLSFNCDSVSPIASPMNNMCSAKLLAPLDVIN